MRNHQFDLRTGESVQVGDHTVTAIEIDAGTQQAILEIEDPDGSVQVVAVDVTLLDVEEPVLV